MSETERVMVDTDAIPTPTLTPEEWREMSNGDLWRGPFGAPGHCHNLLDEWADALDAANERERVLREENTRLRRVLLAAAEQMRDHTPGRGTYGTTLGCAPCARMADLCEQVARD